MSNAVLVFKCSACEADTTVRCKYCEKPVCPRHRAGLGPASEGYFCLGNCLLSGFGGFSAAPQRPPLEKGERGLVTLALVGIAAVLTFLVLYILARRPDLGIWIGK